MPVNEPNGAERTITDDFDWSIRALGTGLSVAVYEFIATDDD